MSRTSGSDDYVRVVLPDHAIHGNESEPDLSGQVNREINDHQRSPHAWNFEFYRQFFDVDTRQVLQRLRFSLLPNPRANFYQRVLKPNADLYGPFWIATTLILAAAVGGNISSYLQSHGRMTSWHYDFKKVTLASTIIYAYWWLVPLGLVAFFYMQSRRSQSSSDADQNPLLQDSESTSIGISTQNFVQLLSIYGYSLAVFVPISILWTIPSVVLQWLLVVIAILISGTFLTFSLFPTLLKEQRKLAGPLVVFIVLLHCAFSIGLMVTFFYGSGISSPPPKMEMPIDHPAPPPDNPQKFKRSLPELPSSSNQSQNNVRVHITG